MTPDPILRVARPTDHIDALVPFYCDGLGFEVVERFREHEGFDGAILRLPGMPYELEFTCHHGHVAGRSPSADLLIVIYIPDTNTWTRMIDRMKRAGYAPVPSLNPYWDQTGKTYEDPDGYRVVLQPRFI